MHEENRGNNIEAQDFRNEIPFVNDAFPNISLVPIEDCGYPEKRSAFFCIEPINSTLYFFWASRLRCAAYS